MREIINKKKTFNREKKNIKILRVKCVRFNVIICWSF